MVIEDLLVDLKRCVEECELEDAKQIARDLLKEQVKPLEVIDKVLIPTMVEIGEKFDKMEIFLPELVFSAEVMQATTAILTENLKKSAVDSLKSKGKVVLGSVFGDIHEIGKNIVKIMLEISGFEVFDLGSKVPSIQFIERAEEVGADVIALSSLMTTTMGSQKEVIELLEALGKRKDYIVIVGGAPTNVNWQEDIGADGWAETAIGAAGLVTKLIEEGVK
ncbi:MAG: cobalamin B12-binding domain-containing protein [Promethearchaeota archaeon]